MELYTQYDVADPLASPFHDFGRSCVGMPDSSLPVVPVAQPLFHYLHEVKEMEPATVVGIELGLVSALVVSAVGSTMPQRNPEESLSIAEAIIAMTRNTAIQVGESERLGTLEAGKQADIVLLDRDIFAVEPHTIGSTSVRMTMVAGEIVYQSVD